MKIPQTVYSLNSNPWEGINHSNIYFSMTFLTSDDRLDESATDEIQIRCPTWPKKTTTKLFNLRNGM